jgi:hypothetical protein
MQTLAYCDMATITADKSFIVQAPAVFVHGKFFAMYWQLQLQILNLLKKLARDKH